MCGIVAYTGKKEAFPLLLHGLKQVEYRGYDSAGIALSPCSNSELADGAEFEIYKRVGRVSQLSTIIPTTPSNTGVAHTRWATHGAVTEANAHPHKSSDGRVVLVHNGIIDNYRELREELIKKGVSFYGETDSEVLVNLIASKYRDSPSKALSEALEEVEGTYGLAIIFLDTPETVYGARRGGPLVAGLSDHGIFLASDPHAFLGQTQSVLWLQDGETIVAKGDCWEIYDSFNIVQKRDLETIQWDERTADLGEHPHYFLKEIVEQPQAVWNTMGCGGRLDRRLNTAKLGGINLSPNELSNIKRVLFVGMGSALFAAECSAQLMEEFARVPAKAVDASELRVGNPIWEDDTLVCLLSQSGETADTIAAAEELLNRGYQINGIINSVGSSLARLCGSGVYLHAGAEFSVASSKAVSSQITAGALLTLLLGRQRHIGSAQGEEIVKELINCPNYIRTALECRSQIKEMVGVLINSPLYIFLGRGSLLPIAREAALKVKELTYKPAEAYSSGALKHGPLALVNETTLQIFLIPGGCTLEKDITNMEEVKARKGRVIAISCSNDPRIAKVADWVVSIPEAHPLIQPLIFLIPLQLFAYELAVALRLDVDRPRNLAKSVTVD